MAKVYKVLTEQGDYIREYSDKAVAEGFAGKVTGRTVVEAKGEKETETKPVDEKVIEGFAGKVTGRTVVEAKGEKEVKAEPIKEEIIDFDIEIKKDEGALALAESRRVSLAKARAKKGKSKKK